jgi:single-strand DNA-binding protein
MPGSLNKVQLIGRLGDDPKAHEFEGGGRVVNFSVATSEQWKDRESGEPRERTQWHQIAVFNEALAEVAQRLLKKGSLVYLEGQLETRKWQGGDGSDRYTTEVVLRPYRSELALLERSRAERPARQPRADSPPAPRR